MAFNYNIDYSISLETFIFFCYKGCACKLVYGRGENLVIISCKSISVRSAALRVHSYHELSGINQSFQMLAQIFDLCATAVAVAQ